MAKDKKPAKKNDDKDEKEQIEAETPDPHATDPGGNVANQASTGGAQQAGEGTVTGGGGAAGGTSGN